ncbi:methyltransferase domain-containing protein [Streptomyces europaeiscabiei]|uniref:class I SAM-dependent methyltransferase n=1 Tax=Streptomyces europaeiscabiei TaxID=146819 RepID=UPI0029BBC33A|nr:methyltransferase domain-containing protein [Streptomyces europaeiscabiei]MDX3711261.1 methyltransferase domain-containing protein [Streptomyces europaeiscabiei]MDX3840091.1 methyltransferase domain-containing protein [Streptomyces europaeiscabiei]
MTNLVSKASVHAFYVDAIRHGKNTAENLQAPTSERFNSFLESIREGTPQTALDLGCGAGNHSIAMARAGYFVVAVDQVPSLLLLRHLEAQGDWRHRIDVRESLVEEYSIDHGFGIVVARDVLHYLSKPDVVSVLESAVANAHSSSHHYLEVFTSITRRSRDGRLRKMEGEAGYSPESFGRLIERLYHGWDVALFWDEHAEKDSRTGENCFEAIRVTVIASNTSTRSGTGKSS